MFDPPKTEKKAKLYRYGAWAGNPKGTPYNHNCCAYEVSDGWLFRQCYRKSGYGPEQLYCKSHAKRVED